MSALPLNLIKGTKNVVYERLQNTEDLEEVEQQMEKIKFKVIMLNVNKNIYNLDFFNFFNKGFAKN